MSEKRANPAPLGLLGFGITTVLLNFVHNAQLGPIDGMILGMGIFYGGIAQIIAGVLEYKNGNTFGTTAFTSYGLFWLSFVALNWLGVTSSARVGIWPFFGGSTPWAVSYEAYAAYFFMWGFFTLLMFFGTTPFAALMAGGAGQALGVRPAIAIGAGVTLVFTIVVFATVPALRRAGR